MRKLQLKLIAVLIITPVTLNAFTGALAGPDLVVDLSELDSGVIIVENIGDAPAAKSTTTLVCQNLTSAGGCGDPPARFERRFTDPAFPEASVFNTRRLGAGQRARINIPFWSATPFAAGDDLEFTGQADAAGDVAEDQETNNGAVRILNF